MSSKKKSIVISRKPTARNSLATNAEIGVPEPVQSLPMIFDDRVQAESGAEQSPSSKPEKIGLIGLPFYCAVYAVSFGVVFGSIILGKLIPGRAVIARGLQDGSDSAKQAARFFQRKQKNAVAF